jgi:CheY-like chemotaxis protein
MPDGHNTKIMIVDDDTFLLDMYGLKFKNKGFDVHAFLKSEEALAQLKEGNVPDIIILDIIMPKLDGIAVLKQIREEKLAPNTTIIMLTNQSQPEDIEKAESLGIDGYIVKALTIPSEVVDQVIKIHSSKKPVTT